MVAPAIKPRSTCPPPATAYAAAHAAAQRPARAGPRKGRIQRNFKISIDVLMLGLFLYLMSYHPGGGLLWHAILGCVLVLLFVLHHALNWHWHRTLLSGRYNLRRGLTTGTDVLLLLAMGAVIVSSYKIASMALPFEFLPPPRGWWRDLHMAATAWRPRGLLGAGAGGVSRGRLQLLVSPLRVRLTDGARPAAEPA